MLTVTFSFDERDITFQDIPGTFQDFQEKIANILKLHSGYMSLPQKSTNHFVNLNQVHSVEIFEQNDE